MADPRSTSTRRAVLSYSQLKDLTKKSGFQWPDLLIKDYQGIIQDFVFTANELDDLDARVTINELNIIILQNKVAELERIAFETVITTNSITASGYQIIICKNTTPITITLDMQATVGTEVHIKRKGAEVQEVGLIDGLTNRTINILNWSSLDI